jgi:pimeloyl-ACP methyl ester carboxylesterase
MSQIQQWSRPDLRRISIDGIAVAVEAVRNGMDRHQTIAWIHGLGSASTLTFAQAARHPALAGITSLLIDLPGHGLSDRPASWTYTIEDHAAIICRVLTEIEAGPLPVIGHSMGGSIAIACAATSSGLMERLIVAEPPVDPGMGDTSAHIAAQAESRFVDRGYRALIRATELQATNGDLQAAEWLRTLKIASPVALHRSATSMIADRSPTLRSQLLGLTIPWAWISGDQTPPLVPPLELPGHKGYVVQDAGHAMMTDNLDGFAEAIVAALGEPGAASAS